MKLFYIALGLLLTTNITFAAVNITIAGDQAKHLYNYLKGPKVEEEGAAGHFYRRGKDVVCRYTNADMDDNKGQPMESQDARRFVCALKFNKNGVAFPRKSF